jgi:hypothetical protein
VSDFLRRHRLLILRTGAAVLCIVALLALQAALFYSRYTPRMAAANADLFDLIVETARREVYADIASRVYELAEALPEAESGERTLTEAWRDFQAHFTLAPGEAIAMFTGELPGLAAGIDGGAAEVASLEADFERLAAIYADRYRDLLDELRRPPLYLWPTARVVAGRSGYRQAATLNRALYLAQTGDIGTARVMLAGLNATVDEPRTLSTIYYTLARLQFELFKETPEVEYYTQALNYLRQSLAADPDALLAQRLLDFLLSLPPTATAPQSAEGRPENPSEGEGAAISAEKRIF